MFLIRLLGGCPMVTRHACRTSIGLFGKDTYGPWLRKLSDNRPRHRLVSATPLIRMRCWPTLARTNSFSCSRELDYREQNRTAEAKKVRELLKTARESLRAKQARKAYAPDR